MDVDCTEKGVIGCKIVVKKDGLLGGTWYKMECPPSLFVETRGINSYTVANTTNNTKKCAILYVRHFQTRSRYGIFQCDSTKYDLSHFIESQ